MKLLLESECFVDSQSRGAQLNLWKTLRCCSSLWRWEGWSWRPQLFHVNRWKTWNQRLETVDHSNGASTTYHLPPTTIPYYSTSIHLLQGGAIARSTALASHIATAQKDAVRKPAGAAFHVENWWKLVVIMGYNILVVATVIDGYNGHWWLLMVKWWLLMDIDSCWCYWWWWLIGGYC